MKITKLFKDFFESEKIAGILLILCTILSVFLANSIYSSSYIQFWHIEFFGHNLEFWINDGLMTIFFLMIGLELEREIYTGELSKIKDALLPIFAAIGGMILPAIIYLIFNFRSNTQSGYGIPMATDIAFALAILTLLGKKVPVSLKIFLTAFAVIDDLGAILVIAIFYTKTLIWTNLFVAISIFIFLLILNRLKIRNIIIYLFFGIIMWFFMLISGIHATISGVLLAFAIPFGNGSSKSSSYILQHILHKPVAFYILPIFALANTAIVLNSNSFIAFSENYSLGIFFGLLIGKPLGIFTLTFVAVKVGFCKLPNDLNWKTILGAGFLGGIGFTMSIFITLLAFENQVVVNNSKFIILITTLFAGIVGFIFLSYALKKTQS